MDRDLIVHQRTRGRPPTLFVDGVVPERMVFLLTPKHKDQILKRVDELKISISAYLRYITDRDLARDNSLELLEEKLKYLKFEQEDIEKQISEEKVNQQRKATEEISKEEHMLSATKHIYDNIVEHNMNYRDGNNASPRLARVLKNIAENVSTKYQILVTSDDLKKVLDKRAAADGKKIIWMKSKD